MKLPSAMMALLLASNPLFAAEKPAAANAGLPNATPADRYKPMMGKGLFSPATPPPAVPDQDKQEAAPSFAQNLYIMGFSNMGGKDYVYIMARDQQRGFSLMEGETSADGVTLVHVDKSPEIGKSKATLKKNTEFGTIGFDEAVISAPPVAQNGAPPPNPGFQNGMPGSNPAVRMPIMPGANGALPPTVSRTRRTNILPPTNPGMQPNGMPNQVVRRPRPIVRPLQ